MNLVSVLPVAMGAVVAFVGFWHLLVYLRGIREREQLYFALACLGVALYDVAAAVSYAGGDRFIAALGQRLQHVALSAIGPSLLWFVVAYTHQERRSIARVFTIFGALQGLAVLTIWNEWILKAGRHVTAVRLPWGATVVYDEARHGILLRIANVPYLATILLLIFYAVRYWRSAAGEDRPRARRLVLGLGVFLAGALNDMAVANSAYEFFYLVEYAYGGLVLVMTYGLSSGVLELARTRSELKQSLARLQRIFDSVQEVYVETTLDGKILEVSPSAQRWIGPDTDLRGRLAMDFYADPKDRDRLRAALEQYGRVRDFEGTARLPDGRLVPYTGNYTLVREKDPSQSRIIASLWDISERKQAEAERRELEQKLLQTQKLESLGVLAGGFAHDFNNLLTGILGSAELAERDLGPDHSVRRRMDLIREAGRQASALCRQMLAYAGRTRFEVSPLNVSRLVNEMHELLRASVSKRALLTLDLDKGIPDVLADAAQIRQIILNLAINASEAIGERAGTVAVRTRSRRCSHADLDTRYLADPLPEGDYVLFEVSDTGAGMDDETRARLFDPFFTTKFSGRGLGLAAVLGIVRGHRGTIQVESQLGQGSTFRVLLPVSEQAESSALAPAAMERWRGRGRVLLVDDESSVREVGEEMLQEVGFEVTLARDGQGAVATFSAAPETFALAMVDLTMPDLDGIEVSRRLLAMRPDLPVLLTSGYSEEESASRLNGAGVCGFVPKPFSLDTLRSKLQAILR